MRPITALLLFALAGCATVQENTGACPLPPPPKREEIARPAGTDYEQILQPGYWDYAAGNYSWRPGRWIKRESGTNQWMDGYWDRATIPGPCNWHPAHWL